MLRYNNVVHEARQQVPRHQACYTSIGWTILLFKSRRGKTKFNPTTIPQYTSPEFTAIQLKKLSFDLSVLLFFAG